MTDSTKLWTADGHALGRFQRVLVQVRTGAMTREAAISISTTLKLARAQLPAAERIGYLGIVAPHAPMVERAAIPIQRESFARIAAEERIYAAGVIEGDGAVVSMKRVFMRPLFRGARRELFAHVGPAAAWLLKAIEEPDARGLLDFVAALRAAM
jgi:hypothetical protein